MVEYTVVLLYEWSKHKDVIKTMFTNNKLKLNSTKINNLTNKEIIEIYTKFKMNNDFKLDEYMIGTSAIYESESKDSKNSDILIKAIKIEDVDNMLIVYKGIEGKFYINLMKKFRDIGCTVLKIIDDEVIFKYKINTKLIKELSDSKAEKIIKIRNFTEKLDVLYGMNIIFSDDFKKQWIKCIENMESL